MAAEINCYKNAIDGCVDYYIWQKRVISRGAVSRPCIIPSSKYTECDVSDDDGDDGDADDVRCEVNITSTWIFLCKISYIAGCREYY